MKSPDMKKACTVLVSVPNAVLASGVKALLCNSKYLFYEHLGTREKLAEAMKVKADILILDADTHEASTASLVKNLKKKNPGTRIVLINVLHHLPGKIAQLIKAGADACISKYAALPLLAEAVEKARAGKIFLCELCAQKLMESFIQPQQEPVATGLTTREETIIGYLAQDYYNTEIADAMSISLRTVETHRKNIMKKLHVRTLAGITRYAMKNGLS